MNLCTEPVAVYTVILIITGRAKDQSLQAGNEYDLSIPI